MRHFQLIALGLAFTLVGCQLPLNLPHALTPSGQSPNGNTPGLAPTDTKAPRMGTLRFAVRWPERSLPGFTAQVIPISTEKLVFTLSNPTLEGFVPIEQELPRQAGEEIASTTLHLPEGAGYNATVTAYDKDDVAIATNTAANVTVTWGKTTPVPITLDALFAPMITDLGVGHGTPGQTVTITGANLARGETTPAVIFPSGVEASGTLQDGAIQATIPTGAGSGQLKVKVDGVTSTSNVMFQEVMSLELTAEGAEEGGIRDGDGAIASWLGDTLPITVLTKDTAHVLVPNPALTGWASPNDGVGAISPTGTFTALKLGRSSLTAHLGGVSGSREVIVAPPAGSIIRPAGNKQGIIDHSLAKVGDRWLVSWYVPSDKTIYWQMFNANGAPVTPNPYSIVGGGTEFERSVRVAAMPDGSSAMLAYTGANFVDGKLRNVVQYRNLDPATGAPLGTLRLFPFPDDLKTNYDSDKLVDLIVAGDQYVVSSMRFDGLEYSQWLRSVRVKNGDTVYERYRYFAADKATPENDFYFYSPTEDAFAITASGSHVIAARHFARSGGSGPTVLQLDPLDANLNPLGGAKAFIHEYNRITSVATNGQVVLTAALETRAAGTTLKLYRYDSTLEQIGLGTTIANLQIAGGDPVNWPLELEWSKSADPADPGRFLLTYARKVGTPVNGQLIYYNQAMVQAINPDGTLDGPAFPLAKDSQVPALVPTDEGGMALWLDSARSLILRRLKYR
jgi:hypothetical protein